LHDVKNQDLAASIERRSLADQIFAHIKRMILSGELGAGERVPEARIGEHFGVSRTPMREALRRLEQYGLVHIKPRCYAEVVRMADEEVDQIAQVRAQVEGLSARLLAERATAEDCAALRVHAAACMRLLEGGDMGAAFEEDSELHLDIARRCANPYVFDIMQRFDARIQLARMVRCGTHEHVLSAVKEHDVLLDAFERNAAGEAEELMKRHVGLMAPNEGERRDG
jgi:DNA-binding GntR family transcriptional regulator